MISKYVLKFISMSRWLILSRHVQEYCWSFAKSWFKIFLSYSQDHNISFSIAIWNPQFDSQQTKWQVCYIATVSVNRILLTLRWCCNCILIIAFHTLNIFFTLQCFDSFTQHLSVHFNLSLLMYEMLRIQKVLISHLYTYTPSSSTSNILFSVLMHISKIISVCLIYDNVPATFFHAPIQWNIIELSERCHSR